MNNSHGGNLNHASRITVLDELIESRSDPRDYFLTTRSIGHKKAAWRTLRGYRRFRGCLPGGK